MNPDPFAVAQQIADEAFDTEWGVSMLSGEKRLYPCLNIDVAARIVREAYTPIPVPSQPPPPAPYWSFLICSHESGSLTNVYLNGRSLGCLRKGVWEAQTLLPNGRPVTLRDVADPVPYCSIEGRTAEGLKAALLDIVDSIVIAEPEPPSQP